MLQGIAICYVVHCITTLPTLISAVTNSRSSVIHIHQPPHVHSTTSTEHRDCLAEAALLLTFAVALVLKATAAGQAGDDCAEPLCSEAYDALLCTTLVLALPTAFIATLLRKRNAMREALRCEQP